MAELKDAEGNADQSKPPEFDAKEKIEEIQRNMNTVADHNHYHVDIVEQWDMEWTLVRLLGLFIISFITMFIVIEMYVFDTERFQVVKAVVDPTKINPEYWIRQRTFSNPLQEGSKFDDPFSTDKYFALVNSIVSESVYLSENLEEQAYPTCRIVYKSNFTTIPKQLSQMNGVDFNHIHRTDRRTFIERTIVVSYNDETEYEEMVCPPTIIVFEYEHAFPRYQAEDLINLSKESGDKKKQMHISTMQSNPVDILDKDFLGNVTEWERRIYYEQRKAQVNPSILGAIREGSPMPQPARRRPEGTKTETPKDQKRVKRAEGPHIPQTAKE